MYSLVVLCVLVAAASASGVLTGALHGVHGAHYGGASQQHFSKNDYGDYAYGYSDPNSHKEETGHATGHGEAVSGSYSYLAPDGHIVHNVYYADENGFRSSLAPTAAHDVHPQPDYSHHGVGHLGVVGHGVAHGVVGHGVVAHGVVGHGIGHGLVGHGVVGHGVGHGVVGHGVLGHGVVGHGVGLNYLGAVY